MTKLTTMKPIIYLLISLCIAGSTFAQSQVKEISAKDCKEGERFVECGTCEATCSNQAPMCTQQCRPPMCMCEDGKVRDDTSGKCIPLQQCKAPIVPIVPPVLPPPRDNGTQQKCKRNEILKQCSGCESQCGQPQIACKMICNNIPKCECDFGFFRNNQTGECVSEKECPTQGQQCGQNEALKSCPGCESTCSNPTPICPAICRLGQACQCLPGYVRNEATRKCVKQAECSTLGGNNTVTECGENERLNQCSGCENNCDSLNRMCNMMCNNVPRCECASGFARNSQTNRCIPTAECSNSRNPRDNGTQPVPNQCRQNETLKFCPGCEPSCSNPTPFCNKMCQEGQACECSQGFARHEISGKCIKLAECPKTGNSTQCKENETLKSCPGCEPTCSNPNPVCIQSCREGQECECSKGFVRNEATGKCVKQAECSAIGGNNTVTECGENERLTQCSGCEANCDALDRMCPMMCNMIERCECASGFARNSQTNKCIPTAQCSNSRNPRDNGTQPNQCKENESLKSCPGCEPTCSNPNPVCIQSCREGQECECSKGFVRDEATGKCVKQAECSNSRNPRDNGTQPEANKCRENEVLTSCPGCEPSCTNKNPICTLQCKLGKECQCQKGFYRNTQGKCVSEVECDATSQNPPSETNSTSCPKNEVYMECGGCEGSCTNHNPICTLQCRPAGCYCPVGKDFVRGPKGHCIHRSVCQKRLKDAVINNDEDEEYNPCAATSCPVNTTCEVIKVQCIRAPCPPQVRCAPANQTTANPCASMLCPENTVCKLNQVQCFTTPCPPIPECVPLNETRPSRSPPIVVDKCADVFCTADSTCVDGNCVPLEENRPPRATDKCAVVRCAANTTCVDGKCVPNSQQNPCATTLCPPNTVCKLNHVVCVRAPCPPIPECVPLNETRPSRSPPVVDKCALIFCTADSTCVDGKCVPLDGNQPPQNDKCAVVRCAANTTCVDGKCIPNPQQNLCLSTLCPPNTVCQLKQVQCIRAPCNPIPECVPINETRPSRATPILDKCAAMMCTADSTCVDGKCVPINSPQQNPCASMLCAANTRCEIVQVNCIQAPCPSQGRCVPLNETEDPTLPLLTCETVDCIQGRVCRMLAKCLDPTKPCPPTPQCVPVTDDLQISDPCSLMDCRDGFKCITIRTNCVMAPCNVTPVEGKCVPINETETEVNRPDREIPPPNDPCAIVRCAAGTKCTVVTPVCAAMTPDCRPKGVCVPDTPRPTRETNPNDDPCATIRCGFGTECAVIMPDCIEGATDCGPKGVCVPRNPTGSPPQVASMPPARDDPLPPQELLIQNKFCMMARCSRGCLTIGIKCNDDGTECEYLGQCAPENFNETSVNVCENSTCPKNKKCEEEIVQCFAPPCLPIPKCVDSSEPQNTNVCANHQCPKGQECQVRQLRCNRLVKNCKSFPMCVNKKQQQ